MLRVNVDAKQVSVQPNHVQGTVVQNLSQAEYIPTREDVILSHRVAECMRQVHIPNLSASPVFTATRSGADFIVHFVTIGKVAIEHRSTRHKRSTI